MALDILRIFIFMLVSIVPLNAACSSNDFIEVELVLQGHKFEPDVIEIPSGKKIKLIVKNLDDSVEEFDSVDLKRERIVPGKATIYIILAPLKPGKYNFIGEFHHDTAKGVIIVN